MYEFRVKDYAQTGAMYDFKLGKVADVKTYAFKYIPYSQFPGVLLMDNLLAVPEKRVSKGHISTAQELATRLNENYAKEDFIILSDRIGNKSGYVDNVGLATIEVPYKALINTYITKGRRGIESKADTSISVLGDRVSENHGVLPDEEQAHIESEISSKIVDDNSVGDKRAEGHVVTTGRSVREQILQPGSIIDEVQRGGREEYLGSISEEELVTERAQYKGTVLRDHTGSIEDPHAIILGTDTVGNRESVQGGDVLEEELAKKPSSHRGVLGKGFQGTRQNEYSGNIETDHLGELESVKGNSGELAEYILGVRPNENGGVVGDTYRATTDKVGESVETNVARPGDVDNSSIALNDYLGDREHISNTWDSGDVFTKETQTKGGVLLGDNTGHRVIDRNTEVSYPLEKATREIESPGKVADVIIDGIRHIEYNGVLVPEDTLAERDEMDDAWVVHNPDKSDRVDEKPGIVEDGRDVGAIRDPHTGYDTVVAQYLAERNIESSGAITEDIGGAKDSRNSKEYHTGTGVRETDKSQKVVYYEKAHPDSRETGLTEMVGAEANTRKFIDYKDQTTGGRREFGENSLVEDNVMLGSRDSATTAEVEETTPLGKRRSTYGGTLPEEDVAGVRVEDDELEIHIDEDYGHREEELELEVEDSHTESDRQEPLEIEQRVDLEEGARVEGEELTIDDDTTEGFRDTEYDLKVDELVEESGQPLRGAPEMTTDDGVGVFESGVDNYVDTDSRDSYTDREELDELKHGGVGDSHNHTGSVYRPGKVSEEELSDRERKGKLSGEFVSPKFRRGKEAHSEVAPVEKDTKVLEGEPAQGLVYDDYRILKDPMLVENWDVGYAVPENYDPKDPFNAYYPWAVEQSGAYLALPQMWDGYGASFNRGSGEVTINTGGRITMVQSYEEFKFRVGVRLKDGYSKIGVIFLNNEDDTEYFKFTMNNGMRPFSLEHIRDGQNRVIAAPMQKMEILPGGNYIVELTVIGNHINIKVNGRGIYDVRVE